MALQKKKMILKKIGEMSLMPLKLNWRQVEYKQTLLKEKKQLTRVIRSWKWPVLLLSQ